MDGNRDTPNSYWEFDRLQLQDVVVLASTKEFDLARLFSGILPVCLLGIGGQQYEMRVQTSVDRTSTQCIFMITASGRESIIFHAAITVQSYSGKLFVYTREHRTDPEKRLPVAFGRVFYRKILDFLPYLATVCHQPLVHIESFEPEVSERAVKLSESRWREMFLPILVARGYQTGGHNADGQPVWQRIYPFEDT